MDIVQNINECIKNSSYTLTELERICGFPKSSIRKWSDNIPSISKVAKVADVLNVSLDRLYYGKEKSSASELSDTEQEVLMLFKQLTPIDQGKEIGRMEAIIENYTPEQREAQ